MRIVIRLFLVFVILLQSGLLRGQEIPKYYYVVIGSFSMESNTEKFAGYARASRYNAAHDHDSERKISYVYVFKTLQKEEAYAHAKQLQADSEFKDSWVFFGTLDKDKIISTPVPVVEEEPTPDTAQIVVATVAPVSDSLPPPVSTTEIAPPSIEITSAAPALDPKLIVKGKLIRFLIEGPQGKIIPGTVHHVDYARGRDIATFEAGKYLDVLPPNSANNPMTIVCAIFGYKEVVKEIDYDKPGGTVGVSLDENKAWVVSYKLEPLNAGDVSVMYRVGFYKDAVVMLPAAQGELDQLVYMMVTNPHYRIKIHGHCNGTSSRRIIALGASKNYFNMAGSNELKGTAKELSKLRAEAIQTYLTDHGIDISRTEIYAWGGLNMLVEETSTSAKLNDRIEIEITGD